MLINQKEVGGVTVISINGRLDAETSGDLAMKFATLLENKKYRLTLDLTDLEYISSAGLRVLLEITKKTRGAGGDTYLVKVQEYVAKVLEISGLSSFLKIYDNIESAIENMNKNRT